MKPKWKILTGVIAVVAIAAGVAASVRWTQRDLVTVQTGKVARADLISVVTASGEVKPNTYINLSANAQGRIVELLVREGDHVRKGQIVARIENIQATADVQAQRAGVIQNAENWKFENTRIRTADGSRVALKESRGITGLP